MEIKMMSSISWRKSAPEEAARIKSEFGEHAELRTPLNSVVALPPDIKNGLNPPSATITIFGERSANNLLAIINDVLDCSKLEAGKLIHQRKYPFFPLRNTLDEVVTLLLATRRMIKGWS